jgi:hypothetical protein
MTTSEQIADLAAALVKAQAEMKPAAKESKNDHFKSKYADFSSVWEACRGPLTTHGIAVLQEVTLTEPGVCVSTRLLHSSGQWIQFEPLTVPVGKRDAHGVGSATSYGKRYALSAAVGVVAEDDDGNAAVETAPVAVKAKPAGYDEWALDITAAAENGLDALREAWKASKAEYRNHAGSTFLDALKAKAAARVTVPA